MSTPSKRGNPLFLIALAMGLLGIIMFVIGATRIAAVASDVITADTRPIPGQFTEELDPETYTVWLMTATSLRDGRAVEENPLPDISRLSITDPSGNPVETSVPPATQSLTRNTKVFTAQANFDATVAGTYEFSIVESAAGEVLVAQSIGSVGWAGLGLTLAGLALLGLAALFVILGLIMRSRAKKQSAPAASTMAPPAPPSSPQYKPGTPYVPGGSTPPSPASPPQATPPPPSSAGGDKPTGWS